MTIKKASTSNIFGIQKFNSTFNASDSLPEIQRINASGGTVTFIQENGINYKIHTFTGSGSFIVTNKGQNPFVQYLIIGGGGAGGGWYGGGGGAGGYLTGTTEITEQTYSISIGNGANGQNNNIRAVNGNPTTALGFTALGGGGGSNYQGGGGTGGSGGSQGSGTAGQGNSGGGSSESGGGGAGEAGQTDSGGKGGNGLNSSINGSMIYRAAGGGGSTYYGAGNRNGGVGGGGNGSYRQATSGGNGETNTGSGGGGGSELTSGNGGSGIVIIRYQI